MKHAISSYRILRLFFAILLVPSFGTLRELSAQVTDSVKIDSVAVNDDSLWINPPLNKKRVKLVAAANISAYGGLLISLNSAWYSQYKRSSFHTFNDNAEWLQVDKVGHVYTAYIASRYSAEMWRWAGVSRKQRIWIGGMSGAVYQTAIEVLDGFSAGWGWSWGDFTANVLGSGLYVSQELAWDEQRIKLKFSFHKKNYIDPELDHRTNQLFGSSLAESVLKDYNAQTYWLSANINSFFPRMKSPPWLAIAVGYGGEGLFGGIQNVAFDKNGAVTFDRRDIKRYRQWFLSPDLDLSMIKTKKKFWKIALGALNAFKFPAPSLELSDGKFHWNWLHF